MVWGQTSARLWQGGNTNKSHQDSWSFSYSNLPLAEVGDVVKAELLTNFATTTSEQVLISCNSDGAVAAMSHSTHCTLG